MLKSKIYQPMACLLAVMGFITSASLQAQQLAQTPLLANTVQVRPNVSFIFDNSGSMNWDCIYKNNVQNTMTGGQGVSDDCLTAETGTNTTDPRQSSPENNSLMYDPRKLYKTGIAANGTPNPNSTSGWSSIRNTSRARFGTSNTDREAIKIDFPAATFNRDAATGAALSNQLNYSTYWVINDGSRFAFRPSGNVNAVVSSTTNPVLKSTLPLRTDCVADATVCTYNEELQNIRNWHTYHRTRMNAAKTGITLAFTGLPDSFRMNYLSLTEGIVSQINLGNGTTPLRPVNNYANAIVPFRTWANNMSSTGSVGTPLRQTLDIVGRYYENNTNNNGPWANTPWTPGTELASDHLSCRRSFAFLMTDGFWNNGSDPIGNYVMRSSGIDTDGLQGPLITHSNSTTYRYTPFAIDPANGGDFRNRGKPDRTSGVGYASTLADVALYFWSRDLRTLANNVTKGRQSDPAFWQNLTTYTLGFGVTGTLNTTTVAAAQAGNQNWPQPAANSPTAVDDMIHAAHNSGGEFISVNDAAEFEAKVRQALLSIGGETASQAGVAVSGAAIQAGSKKYAAFFTSGDWVGNLVATNLVTSNVNTTSTNSTAGQDGSRAWSVIQVDSNEIPVKDGASTIPKESDRNIWVYVNNTVKAVEFIHSRLNTNNLIAAATATPSVAAAQLTSTFVADMTDFIRGKRDKEGAGKPYRERIALLGDIVNSRPALIKNVIDPRSAYNNLPTSVQGGANSYPAYKALKAARNEGVLFVGANDGMLHAFRESDGREVFGFIPRSVLSKLHKLTEKNYALSHQFYVDGPMRESDAYINAPNLSGTGTGNRWTNVLVGTTGAGAKSVFALDVTKPLEMQGRHVLWEISNNLPEFAQLGHVLADVDTGVTPSGDWVAVVGNGYDSSAGRASLYLVNLSTGAKIRELTTNTATANGLGGVRLVRNASAQIVGAYAGDLLGNVWRFDLTGGSATDWKNGELLYSTKDPANATLAQPITAAPGVFTRNDGRPGYMVVVGTGRMLTTNDADLTLGAPTQSAYGLWDTAIFGSTATFTPISGRSQLVSSSIVRSTSTFSNGLGFDNFGKSIYAVQNSTPLDWSIHRGWVMDYIIPGENGLSSEYTGLRSIYPIEALNTLVRIDTIAPKSSLAQCAVEGSVRAINFLLNPYSGACKAGSTIDNNNDNAVDAADGNSCAYSGLGDGSNAVLEIGDPADPLCATGNCGDKYIVGATERRRINDGGTPAVGCNPATDAFQCKYRRDVRQIFIRK
jgi:type IV pilus assembly protein PilY1